MKWREILKLYFSSPKGIYLSGIVIIVAVITTLVGIPLVWAGFGAFILLGGVPIISLSVEKGAAAVVGEKERRQVLRNRARLEEAALLSRKLGKIRLADAGIKKLLVRLCYEADRYIFRAKANSNAVYDPLILDSLVTACSVLDAFLNSGNEAAVEKYFSVEANETAENSGVAYSLRDKTIHILENSLRLFIKENNVNSTADNE
jgi:hypothetical protein